MSAAPMNITRRGKVVVMTLDNPPANAITPAWLDHLEAVIITLESASDWNVLHIRSALRVFAAGSDLGESLKRMQSPDAPAVQQARVARLQALFDRLESLPAVTFAEIGGAAMGGGMELALACDLRMVAREAKVGLPEVGLGLIPAAGGMQRVTALCGRAVASRLVLGAEHVDGAEALALGLVQWAVPRAELEAAALATVDRIAALPRDALSYAKRCLLAHAGIGKDVRERGMSGAQLDRELSAALNGNPETLARIQAFFEQRGGAARQAK